MSGGGLVFAGLVLYKVGDTSSDTEKRHYDSSAVRGEVVGDHQDSAAECHVVEKVRDTKHTNQGDWDATAKLIMQQQAVAHRTSRKVKVGGDAVKQPIHHTTKLLCPERVLDRLELHVNSMDAV